MFIYLKLKTLLALINSILGWSLNLSILLRIDSSYDESGNTYMRDLPYLNLEYL